MKSLRARWMTVTLAGGAAALWIVSCGGDGSTTPRSEAPQDAGVPDDGSVAADSGLDAQSSADVTTQEGSPPDASASGDASTEAGPATPPIDVSVLEPGVWSWFQFPNTVCRDGSQTGFSVNVSPSGSKKIMFFLEGGGACFDELSCAGNLSHVQSTSVSTGGVFDRTNDENPFEEYTMVDVPYCTGDVHAGNNPDGGVGGQKQQFVGYPNTGYFLRKIAASFPDTEALVFAGSSAGGFGVAANYGQALAAFPSIPVFLLDDSGPFMRQPPLAHCLQSEFANVWGLDRSVLAECGADCEGQDDWMLALARHWVTRSKYATGLISATGDGTISLFWGFGANDCTSPIPLPISAADFAAGLTDIETQMEPDENFGAYLYGGSNHTVLEDGLFYSTTVDGGGSIAQWARTLVEANQVTNVGP